MAISKPDNNVLIFFAIELTFFFFPLEKGWVFFPRSQNQNRRFSCSLDCASGSRTKKEILDLVSVYVKM